LCFKVLKKKKGQARHKKGGAGFQWVLGGFLFFGEGGGGKKRVGERKRI